MTGMHIRTGPIIIFILVALVVKAPILILFAFLALVLVTGATIAIPNKSKKAIAAPGLKNIPGVGEVEWVTDPRQLDHKRLLKGAELKALEDAVLDCSPGDWIEEGEEAAEPKEEAAPVDGAVVRHPKNCRCGCWLGKSYGAMIAPQDAEIFELTVEEQEEPVATYYLGRGRYSQDGIVRQFSPGTQPYARGGIVHPNERVYIAESPKRRTTESRNEQRYLAHFRNQKPRLADHMVNRWG